ncbi:hypothetical protein L6Q79_10220 [bacterium]|nr:hypothetical protein [bacterium]NUN46991.1 hypothetical protein [bacterium]
MVSFRRIALLTLVFIVIASTVEAADRAPVNVLEAARKNIILTLKGVNESMQADAIQTLIELHRQYPEMDFSEAVPALLGMLDGHRSYSVRILSALALAEIGGISYKDAISKRALNDQHPCVRHVCAGIMAEFKM